MEINECILGMALANNGLHTDWMMIRLRSDKEILNKIEELQKIRFEHSKICQIPLDKCDEAKEYAYPTLIYFSFILKFSTTMSMAFLILVKLAFFLYNLTMRKTKNINKLTAVKEKN